jgi:hypothetical protein
MMAVDSFRSCERELEVASTRTVGRLASAALVRMRGVGHAQFWWKEHNSPSVVGIR